MIVRALQCALTLAILSAVSAIRGHPDTRQQAAGVTSAPMTRVDNGAFFTNITLEGMELLLRVDTSVVGILVSCAVWTDASCITDFDKLEAESEGVGYLYTSFTYYNTKRFKTATVGGLDYVGLDAKVAYSNFSEFPGASQGILGLASYSADGTLTSPLILDNQLGVISLTVGNADETSTLTFNGYDTTQTTKSKYATAAEFNLPPAYFHDWHFPLSCFHLPRADGSEDDSYYNCVGAGVPHLDPSVPWIIVDDFTLDTFHRRFATSCTFVDDTYYICDASVPLPRLTLPMSTGWEFYLEAEDYVEQIPYSSPAQVKVLLTARDHRYSWIFGAPFMSKYYTSMATSTGYLTIFCEEGKTCKKTGWSVSDGDNYRDDDGIYGNDDSSGNGDYSSAHPFKKSWVYAIFGTLGLVLFVGACIWRSNMRQEDTKKETEKKNNAEVTGTEAVSGVDISDSPYENAPMTVLTGSERNNGVYQEVKSPTRASYN